MNGSSALDYLAIAGAVLVAIGLGWWWPPAGLIWLGLAMIAAAFAAGYAGHGGGDDTQRR